MDPRRRSDVNRVFADFGKAIAAYERTLNPGESRFDRYARAVVAGDPAGQQALSSREVHGLRLFLGKGQCATYAKSPRAAVGHSELAHDGAGHHERKRIRLSESDVQDLAAFLRTLSSCCRCRLTWLPMPDDLHPEARATRRGYFARRWHGDVRAAVLLWRDMLALGTLVNLAVTFAALFMLSQGAPLAVAAAVHFSPAPYNAFLVAAFWRSAQRTTVTGAIAVAWLCLVTLI
jgi:hypothetical protein